MKITVEGVGKRFVREFILKNVNLEFNNGESYAILGPNGSGKSTLMQLLSGSISPTKGHIHHKLNGKDLPVERWYQHIAYAAPYLQLMEEFTLAEQLAFHTKFKPFRQQMTEDDVLQITGLQAHKNKLISAFSSGMKQRVKLALAILSQAEVVLLDEPATNLDAEGVQWYQKLVNNHTQNSIVLVGSNRQDEYAFCRHHVRIQDFK